MRLLTERYGNEIKVLTSVVIYVMLRMKNTGKENKNRFPCFLQKNRGGGSYYVEIKRKKLLSRYAVSKENC